MSTGLGLTTILDCLRAGEDEMGWQSDGWQAGTNACDEQKMFAAKQVGWRKGLALFSKEALRGYATTVYADLLAKMTEWRMRIDPPPNLGPTAVYMISQLKEMMKWARAGKRYHRGVAWPEFKLDEAVFYRFGPEERDLVAVVEVDGGDTVCMMPDTGPNLEGMGLYEAILRTEAMAIPEMHSSYQGVVVPCVRAKINVSLEWIIGLINEGNYIAYADQLIEFGMNELGFATREETVMASLRSMSPRKPEPFILSLSGEPIRFWRWREGVDFPILMCQITQDDFSDPGNLEDIVK